MPSLPLSDGPLGVRVSSSGRRWQEGRSGAAEGPPSWHRLALWPEGARRGAETRLGWA